MPANVGGKNGTVVASTSSATGGSVTVSYPDDPGPPPVPAHEETYEPADAWFVTKCDSVNSERPKIDVVCDATGKPTSASVHK